MPIKDIFLAVMVVALWGVNFVAIKVGVTEFPPLLLTAVRFGLAGLVMLPWIMKIKREQLPGVLGITLTMGVGYFAFLFVGMQGVPAHLTIILVQIEIPLASIIACWWFKERFTLRLAIGTVIALIGVVITVGLPEKMGAILSIGFILIAALCWSISANQIRGLPKIHPLTMNGAVSLMSCPCLFVLTAILEPQSLHHMPAWNWQGVAALLFMIFISTILCYSLWFKLLTRNSVTVTVPFLLLQVPFGVLASVILLGEPLAWHIVVGGLVCIAGLAIVLKKNKAS